MEPVVAEASATAEPAVAPPSPPAEGPEQAAPAPAPAPDGGAPLAVPTKPAPDPCPNCGAPFVEGQHWCLECGAGAPGRARRRAGWPVAGSTVAVALLVAGGAVAATYAALNSSSRKAVAPPPTVAQVRPVVPPATATPSVPIAPNHAVKTPHVPAGSPGLGPTAGIPTHRPRLHRHKAAAAPTTPSTPSVPKPAPPAGTAPKPAPTGPPIGTGHKRITLDTDAAGTYNPYAYPPGNFGDPASAIDDDPTTAWTAATDPNGKINAGLTINLKSPQRARAITIQGTKGLVVEIYGTEGPAPASITDPAWVHVGTGHLTARKDRIVLRSSKRLQSLVIWIPAAPAGKPQVKIAEVAVYR